MTETTFAQQVAELEHDWANNPRWQGITRPYTAEDVVRLRGSMRESHTVAKTMSERLWELMTTRDYINTLEAI